MQTQQSPDVSRTEVGSHTRRVSRGDPLAARSNAAETRGGRLRLQPIVRDLRDAVADLLRKPSTKADPLLSIVERIRGETRIEPLSEVLKVLAPQADTADFSETNPEIDSLSSTCRLAYGVRTAILASSLLPSTGISKYAYDTVMLAALLQDVGFAALARRHKCAPGELKTRNDTAYRSHPILGAAVVTGMRRSACDLPAIVAEHHERLNGIGYPNGRRARQLTTTSRFLQIMCRVVRQASVGLAARGGHTEPPLTLSAAIERACDDLEELTALGRFDTGLSSVVLERIRSVDFGGARVGDAKPDATRRVVPVPKFLDRKASVDLGAFVQTTSDP